MLSIFGHAHSACDGVSRRQVLQAAGAGLLGLSLPRVLAARELTDATGPARVRPARAKAVIFLFLFGGPSQLETFVLKPEAPEKIRGPFKPISTVAPERARITSLGRKALPLMAFSAAATSTRSRTSSPALMIMWPSASALAAPPMSFFISSMPLDGLMSRPPVSKQMPLPITVTLTAS